MCERREKFHGTHQCTISKIQLTIFSLRKYQSKMKKTNNCLQWRHQLNEW